MEEILKLKNVVKSYQLGRDNRLDVLKKVSLTIYKGEFVAIMGPSGAGKSTLLHMIGLLDRPTTGEIVINNHNVQDLSNRELANLRRKEIGFVFQSFNLLPKLNAHQNVVLPAVYTKANRVQRNEQAYELLKKVGLEARIKHRPNEMSGGEKQRVAMARSLMNDPEIILADEPTGNLDSASGKSVLKLLHKLHHEGKTIVVVTHDQSIAKEAQRVIRLKDGKIINE